MESANINQAQLVNPSPKTLAQERQAMTPPGPDSWFDSDQQQSFPDSDQNQENTLQEDRKSKILKSVSSVEKNQKQQRASHHQQLEKTELIQTQRFAKDSILNEKQRNFKAFYHRVDEKLIVLLLKMVNLKIVNLNEIADLRDKGSVELFIKNKQLIVKTTDKAQADQAINKLSDFIDELNIMKLDIKTELAIKLQNCRKVRQQLLNRNIILLNLNNYKQVHGMYIGGRFKISELQKTQLQIRNYQIFTIKLFRFRNRRSYRLIIDQIFQFEGMARQMMEFNGVSMLEVDTYNRQNNIRVIMNIKSKKSFSALQYQEFIIKKIAKYFVVCFILESQAFFEKLSVSDCPEIKFFYIKEKNHKHQNISYLIIIAQVETFLNCNILIEAQVQKVSKYIVGIRFFNHIFPEFSYFFFDPQFYYINRFPRVNTYSMLVLAKTNRGAKFNFKETFKMFQSMKKVIEKSKINQQLLQGQGQQK